MIKQKVIQLPDRDDWITRKLILTYDPDNFFVTPSIYWHKTECHSLIGIAWLRFDMCLRKEF